jgi:N utilization substance protein B
MSNKRHQSRVLAMQALYEWQINPQDIGHLIQQAASRGEKGQFSRSFLEELLQGTLSNLGTLDEQLKPLLGRALEGLDPVELAIIRLGARELTAHIGVPYRVVINEWVEITKAFGAEQGHRFVNGLLDRLAKMQRTLETPAGANGPG